MTASLRETRRLNRMQAVISTWWAAVPFDRRVTYYSGTELARHLGAVSVTAFGPALASLGWKRELVRLGGVQAWRWLSPGAASLKQPVGRPSFASIMEQAHAFEDFKRQGRHHTTPTTPTPGDRS